MNNFCKIIQLQHNICNSLLFVNDYLCENLSLYKLYCFFISEIKYQIRIQTLVIFQTQKHSCLMYSIFQSIHIC